MDYLSIILPTLIVGVVILVLWRTVWPIVQQNRLTRILLKSGTDAEGIVLQVHQTGTYVNNLPQLNIQMQVVPAKGQNFVTELKEIVALTDLPAVQPGLRLKVKFNPHNHKQVMILKSMH